ncbi:MAG TPA: DUF4190 domain-containing protein [Kofleriaceae bacterium]
MYRDDLVAAHARLEHLERDLADATSQVSQDQQRIAQLTAQLAAAREALARMGQVQAAPAFPGYAAPQYIYPSRSSTVLVLGILSLVLCSVIGPIAWSMGNEELRRIENGQTPDFGRGSVVAGRVCGIVSTALLILGGFAILMGLAVSR